MRRRVWLCLATALATAGCSIGAGSSGGGPPSRAVPYAGQATDGRANGVRLTVYAAASLGRVLTEIAPAYEATHAGTTLVLSTDSSAALATKIEQGAPADVFLSADLATPRRLVDAGLALGAVVPFADNRLAVIVPEENPAGIERPQDLARSGVKIVAAGAHVPITAYATALIHNLAAEEGYPAGFADAYAANIVSREDNVAAVVAKIALGEGDAAIVYLTDAAGSTGVATIEVPDAANVRATYGGVVVAASVHEGPAAAFLDWLAGPDGRLILTRHGFLPPS